MGDNRETRAPTHGHDGADGGDGERVSELLSSVLSALAAAVASPVQRASSSRTASTCPPATAAVTSTVHCIACARGAAAEPPCTPPSSCAILVDCRWSDAVACPALATASGTETESENGLTETRKRLTGECRCTQEG